MEKVTIYALLGTYVTRQGKATLSIPVLLNGSYVTSLPTGIKLDPQSWDAERRMVLKAEPKHQAFNLKIRSIISELETRIEKKQGMGEVLTKSKLKRIAEGNDPGQDFYKFCRDWIATKYTNKETLRTYNSEVSKLEQFTKECSFADLDPAFLTKYKRWMEKPKGKKLGNSENTIWKSFKFMNTMILDAMKQKGFIDSNPFDEFNRGRYRNPEKLGIEISDCNAIELVCQDELQPVINRRVALKFLLMCYSGLRFNDAMAFDPAIHVINGDTISIRTQKAKQMLHMKTYDRLQSVIERLKETPTPMMTNQEFNRILKMVGSSARIQMPLTCHVGRHTFGGLLAEMKVPIEIAQPLLAHKDRRSTEIYYHLKKKNLDDAMGMLNGMK